MIRDMQFRPVKCKLQRKLKKDIRNNINVPNKLLVPANKTSNYYRMEPNRYKALLSNNITSEYKKAEKAKVVETNAKMRNIVEILKIEDRVMKTAERQTIITLKDHNQNFNNLITYRLINPTKPEIVKISKQLLEEINRKINCNLKLNLWRSTTEVQSKIKNAIHL